ncbi:hypothetical protein, partial [Phaeovulum sp.]|uniref:hypothetical protein n=1 Tax=Phaeovulum sp. TaxID=2934796 RepID=UPI0039E25983
MFTYVARNFAAVIECIVPKSPSPDFAGLGHFMLRLMTRRYRPRYSLSYAEPGSYSMKEPLPA